MTGSARDDKAFCDTADDVDIVAEETLPNAVVEDEPFVR